jgi:hypothetical protein
MSRTLKDMRAGIRERRRRPVLTRDRARAQRLLIGVAEMTGYERRGRRRREESCRGVAVVQAWVPARVAVGIHEEDNAYGRTVGVPRSRWPRAHQR